MIIVNHGVPFVRHFGLRIKHRHVKSGEIKWNTKWSIIVSDISEKYEKVIKSIWIKVADVDNKSEAEDVIINGKDVVQERYTVRPAIWVEY